MQFIMDINQLFTTAKEMLSDFFQGIKKLILAAFQMKHVKFALGCIVVQLTPVSRCLKVISVSFS